MKTLNQGERQPLAVVGDHLIHESAKAATLRRVSTSQAEAQHSDRYTDRGYGIHRMPCSSSFRTSRGPGR